MAIVFLTMAIVFLTAILYMSLLLLIEYYLIERVLLQHSSTRWPSASGTQSEKGWETLFFHWDISDILVTETLRSFVSQLY